MKWKALHFLLVCFNENIEKPAVDRRSTNTSDFIISEKVNGIVEENTNSLKTLVNMLIIDSKKHTKKS